MLRRVRGDDVAGGPRPGPRPHRGDAARGAGARPGDPRDSRLDRPVPRPVRGDARRLRGRQRDPAGPREGALPGPAGPRRRAVRRGADGGRCGQLGGQIAK